MSIKQNPDGSQVIAQRNLVLRKDPLLRSDGVARMNVDGTTSGTSLIVWNGTGAQDSGGDWTRSPLAGQTETTDAARTGTNGLDVGVRTQDDYTEFNNGSNTDVDGVYGSLTFWMQPKAYPEGSEVHICWEDIAGTTIGSQLNLISYINDFDLDEWQKVTIPIQDFNLEGAQVAKIVFIYAGADGQQLYFDDLQFEGGSGGPHLYSIGANVNEKWHLEELNIVISDSDTGWRADSFAALSSGLSNGLLIRLHDSASATTFWSINFKQNVDLFGQLLIANEVTFSGKEQLFTLALRPGAAATILEGDTRLEILIRDDLTGLSALRAYVQVGVEDITE